jgi:hypothetical protein
MALTGVTNMAGPGGGNSLVDDGTSLSSTEPIRLANGSVGTPSYSFTNFTNQGMWTSASGQVNFSGNGAWMFGTASGATVAIQLRNGNALAWSSGTSPNLSNSTLLTSPGAANLQFGAANAAAPVAQTLSFQGARGGTDSNTAAVDATVQGSLGTGTGAAGNIIFKTGVVQGSGSTAHVATTALTLDGSQGATIAGALSTGAAGFTISSAGLPTKSNSITTAGQGFPVIVGITSQRSESAADANVLTFTPPAAVGAYRIAFVMDVSAANTATLGWTATWKNSNGAAIAPTNLALTKFGVAAPALTFSAAANDSYYGECDITVDNSATAIVVKLTFAGTSFTAKVSAWIERVI